MWCLGMFYFSFTRNFGRKINTMELLKKTHVTSNLNFLNYFLNSVYIYLYVDIYIILTPILAWCVRENFT